MNNHRKSSKNQSSTGNIRIIAGKHRGRKLPVLMADGLRPTTDRVKETVFNWLMPYVHGSACLDCFAGAGSLGFEAYSRGAASVLMIELNKQAASQLVTNANTLKANEVTVKQTDTLAYLAGQTQGFDIVFIDPPFNKGMVEQVINHLDNGWLNKDTMVYLEMEAHSPLPSLPSNWQLEKEKVAGQVAYRLFHVS